MRILGLITDIVRWLRPAFETFGYAIVSAGVFLESAVLLSIVVPGDVILAMGGVYAAEGSLALPTVVALGVIFGVLGETAGFLLGRRYGASVVARLPFHARFQQHVDRAQEALRRRGGRTIVIGRFTMGVAGTVPFAAGTSGVSVRTFLLFAVPTVAVWATAVILVGYVVGDQIAAIDRILSTAGWVVLGIIALGGAGLFLWRRHH